MQPAKPLQSQDAIKTYRYLRIGMIGAVVLLLLACSERKGLGGEEGASNDDATGASDDADDTASSTGGVEDMGTPDCAPILQMDGSPSGFEECMSSAVILGRSASARRSGHRRAAPGGRGSRDDQLRLRGR